MHVRCPDRLPEETRQVLEAMAELSPIVQALPPTAVCPRDDLRGLFCCSSDRP